MVQNMKYITSFLKEFKKTPVFTIKDVEKFLTYKGSTKAYSKIFIALMVKSGRAHKLGNGFYTLYNDMDVVGFQFYPFYYGLGFALTKYKLWKQQSNQYVITTRNVRRGNRKAFGLNFTVSKISNTMFFGYSYIKGTNFYFPISDIEKTLIDCIYYKFNLEDYAYVNIFKNLEDKKMANYLKKCNKRVNSAYNKLKRTYATKAKEELLAGLAGSTNFKNKEKLLTEIRSKRNGRQTFS
jgi:predicted transcriptional regulator of viral defense system